MTDSSNNIPKRRVRAYLSSPKEKEENELNSDVSKNDTRVEDINKTIIRENRSPESRIEVRTKTIETTKTTETVKIIEQSKGAMTLLEEEELKIDKGIEEANRDILKQEGVIERLKKDFKKKLEEEIAILEEIKGRRNDLEKDRERVHEDMMTHIKRKRENAKNSQRVEESPKETEKEKNLEEAKRLEKERYEQFAREKEQKEKEEKSLKDKEEKERIEKERNRKEAEVNKRARKEQGKKEKGQVNSEIDEISDSLDKEEEEQRNRRERRNSRRSLSSKSPNKSNKKEIKQDIKEERKDITNKKGETGNYEEEVGPLCEISAKRKIIISNRGNSSTKEKDSLFEETKERNEESEKEKREKQKKEQEEKDRIAEELLIANLLKKINELEELKKFEVMMIERTKHYKEKILPEGKICPGCKLTFPIIIFKNSRSGLATNAQKDLAMCKECIRCRRHDGKRKKSGGNQKIEGLTKEKEMEYYADAKVWEISKARKHANALECIYRCGRNKHGLLFFCKECLVEKYKKGTVVYWTHQEGFIKFNTIMEIHTEIFDCSLVERRHFKNGGKSILPIKHKKCNEIWYVSIDDLINAGNGCGVCRPKPWDAGMAKEMLCLQHPTLIDNGITDTLITRGNQTPFPVKCTLCQNCWSPTINSLQQGHGCKTCQNGEDMTYEELMCHVRGERPIKDKYGNVDIEATANKEASLNLIDFTGVVANVIKDGTRSHIPLRCKNITKEGKECNNRWNPSINSVIHKRSGCPKCSKSKGERECWNLLDNYEDDEGFILEDLEGEFRFKNKENGYDFHSKKILRNPKIKERRYDFRFIYREQKYLLEYDGEQHFGYTPIFHDEKSGGFEKAQEVDIEKTIDALKEGYFIIRIDNLQLKNLKMHFEKAVDTPDVNYYFSDERRYSYILKELLDQNIG